MQIAAAVLGLASDYAWETDLTVSRAPDANFGCTFNVLYFKNAIGLIVARHHRISAG
jgi:hypothetical protein